MSITVIQLWKTVQAGQPIFDTDPIDASRVLQSLSDWVAQPHDDAHQIDLMERYQTGRYKEIARELGRALDGAEALGLADLLLFALCLLQMAENGERFKNWKIENYLDTNVIPRLQQMTASSQPQMLRDLIEQLDKWCKGYA